MNGLSNTFIPYTINGLADLTSNGEIIDPANYVKYAGNTNNTDLDGFNLTTTGIITSDQFDIPSTSANSESWSIYAISTMGNPSTLGGLLFTETSNGNSVYMTGGVVGSKGFQFDTLDSSYIGKVVVTDANKCLSTTISASQLNYITALTSQAGGVDQSNTWTGSNNFTTLTSVGALRITSSIANNDYSLSVNSFDQLEIRNITTGNTMTTSGDALAILNINAGGTITTGNIEVAGNSQLIGSGTVVWTQTALSDDYEIKDDVGDTRLKLSKTTGLTISTLNVTAVPSATPTLALGVNGSGGVVSFAVPVATNILPLANTFTNTNTFTSTITQTGNSFSLANTGFLTSTVDSGSTSASVVAVSPTTISNVSGTYTALANSTVIEWRMRIFDDWIGGVNYTLTMANTNWSGVKTPIQITVQSPAGTTIGFAFATLGGTSEVRFTYPQGANGNIYIYIYYLPLGPTPTFTWTTLSVVANVLRSNFYSTKSAMAVNTTVPSYAGFALQSSSAPNGAGNETTIQNFIVGDVSAGTQFPQGYSIGFNAGNLATTITCQEASAGSGTTFYEINSHASYHSWKSRPNTGVSVDMVLVYNSGNGGLRLNKNGAGRTSTALLDVAGEAIVDSFIVNGDFRKVGGASGTNYFGLRGTDALNSPYLEFFTANVRRSYIGYATATSMNVFSENGASLQLGSDGQPRLTIDTTGNLTMVHQKSFFLYSFGASNNAGFKSEASGDISIFTGTAGVATRMTISNGGDVNVASNLIGGTLVVTGGGGTYQAGCIYSDGNWGMLFRARQVPAAGIFGWYDSAGSERMKMLPNGQLQLTTVDGPGFVHTNGTIIVESYIGGGGGWIGTRTNHPLRFYTNNSSTRMSVNIDGTVNIATRLAIGGVNSSGVLDIVNPNGIYTHFGWTDNQNYIRGVATIMDCHLTLASSGSAGGTPRIQSGNGNRSMRYDDGNLVTWLLNNSGSVPIPWTHSSWGAGSGGGYTVIARNEGINEMGLGFGVSNYRSVIISLAPAIIWGEIILSGGTIYTSCNGTINLYTAGGGWIFISDKRCKRDIKDIKTTRSLERIMALKPKTYKKIYPENPETPISDKVRDADHIGFLAQDVMESNPHCIDEWVDDKAVCDDDDGKRLGIAYGDINVHMVGAIQELKKQNDRQQKEIDELKELVQQLLAKK
jgi:hypothetical protein